MRAFVNEWSKSIFECAQLDNFMQHFSQCHWTFFRHTKHPTPYKTDMYCLVKVSLVPRISVTFSRVSLVSFRIWACDDVIRKRQTFWAQTGSVLCIVPLYTLNIWKCTPHNIRQQIVTGVVSVYHSTKANPLRATTHKPHISWGLKPKECWGHSLFTS